MFDGEKFGEQVVGMVRDYVERTLAPVLERNQALAAENGALIERLAALEAREMPEAVKGDPGKDCDMEAVAQLIADGLEKAVGAIPAAKDGVGVAGAMKNAEGHLILTLSDGTLCDIGMVDGRDGKNGETFTLDDFDIVQTDDRTFKFCFTRGETMHSFEFALPFPLDRGVWAEDGQYEKGDAVSWAGSFWIAQRDNPGKPDSTDSGWRLAVKRGRDGKNAKEHN